MHLGTKIEIKFTSEIIDERDGFVVFYKPGGLLTHPPNTNSEEPSLLDHLLFIHPEIKDWGEKGREGIVHRLDKPTSGLLLCAYEETVYKSLKHELSDRNIKRNYFAFVENKAESIKGRIDAPIGIDPRKRGKKKVLKGGRSSVTEYKVISSTDSHSILDVNLITGRTHQIRTHLSYIGNPIINDTLYGASSNKEIPDSTIGLHAYRLEFKSKGRDYSYEQSLPGYLENLYK